jgi:hypothetical protein
MWGSPPLDQVHTNREYVGLGTLGRSVRNQPTMANELVHQPQNLSMPQMAHGLTQVARGMPGKADHPSTPTTNGLHGATRNPSPSGRVKAVQTFGLGPAYARPGPQDDTHTDNPPTDYFHSADPLEKYVGARDVLGPGQEYGSGFPRTHELSQFPTMGMDLLQGFVSRTAQVASNVVPPPRFDKGTHRRDNRQLGGQL